MFCGIWNITFPYYQCTLHINCWEILSMVHTLKNKWYHRKRTIYFLIIKDTPKRVLKFLSIVLISWSEMSNLIFYGLVCLLPTSLRNWRIFGWHCYQAPPLPQVISTFLQLFSRKTVCVFSKPQLLFCPHLHWPSIILVIKAWCTNFMHGRGSLGVTGRDWALTWAPDSQPHLMPPALQSHSSAWHPALVAVCGVISKAIAPLLTPA